MENESGISIFLIELQARSSILLASSIKHSETTGKGENGDECSDVSGMSENEATEMEKRRGRNKGEPNRESVLRCVRRASV